MCGRTVMKSCRQRGFTLVELATVMIIIGILFGGVLQAQNIIENARVKAVIAQYKGLMAAHYGFQDKYGVIPGDAPNATQKLPGCDASNNCTNGNGDGTVGTRFDNAPDRLATPNASGTPGINENIQYWKHLALADLVEGIVLNASNAPASSAFGVSHPAAKISETGWNAILTNPAGIGEYGGPGLVFQLSGAPNANIVAVTPGIAARIDQIVDDGMPNSGIVTSEYSPNCEDDAMNSYNVLLGGITCLMYFSLQ